MQLRDSALLSWQQVKIFLPPEANIKRADLTKAPLYVKDYVYGLEERLEKVRKVAMRNSIEAQEVHKKGYDVRYKAIARPAFKPGDLVWMRNLHIPSDALRKVVPAYRGPFKVESTVRADEDCHTYRLTELLSGKPHVNPINEFHLKPFRIAEGKIFSKGMFTRH